MCDCESHMPVTNPVIRQLLKQISYETELVTFKEFIGIIPVFTLRQCKS